MNTASLYQLFLQHPVITTDSRDCEPGSIFFALKGSNFDGNLYAAAALEKGCSYCVVDNPDVVIDSRYILVDDVLLALQQLAHHHRRQLATPIVGITGTNGKTTTKELTAAVLTKKYQLLFTQGNFNNEIGVPKTLLSLTSQHDMAVVEMGANHLGDIRLLANIVEPDHALITNVGSAHLEGFGSFEGVMQTKGELYTCMQEKARGGYIFRNLDNPYLQTMQAQYAPDVQTIGYGHEGNKVARVVGKITANNPLVSVAWKDNADPKADWHEVDTNLIGAYNLDNILAAITIGLTLGVEPADIDVALSEYVPKNNRSQLMQTANNRLVVDAYNANPTSMQAAIDNFAGMQVANKMMILGDMRELGSVSAEEHQKVVELIGQTDIREVWLVGPQFMNTHCGFRKFADTEAVKQALEREKPQQKTILIKGSNGMKLFTLTDLL